MALAASPKPIRCSACGAIPKRPAVTRSSGQKSARSCTVASCWGSRPISLRSSELRENQMETVRADQIGSLLRPPELVQAWGLFFAGQLAPDRLDEIEDRAIQEVLHKQQQTGIGIYTDGEFRRIVYLTSLAQAVDGFVMGDGDRLPWKATGGEVPREMQEFTLPVVTERLRLKFRVSARESAFLRAHAPGPFKITIPSPVHFVNGSWKKGISDAAYPTPYDLLADITRILSDEAAQLAREGVPYIQVDSPTYTQFLDAEWDDWFSAHGLDKERLLDEAIGADNAILDAARAEGAYTA